MTEGVPHFSNIPEQVEDYFTAWLDTTFRSSGITNVEVVNEDAQIVVTVAEEGDYSSLEKTVRFSVTPEGVTIECKDDTKQLIFKAIT